MSICSTSQIPSSLQFGHKFINYVNSLIILKKSCFVWSWEHQICCVDLQFQYCLQQPSWYSEQFASYLALRCFKFLMVWNLLTRVKALIWYQFFRIFFSLIVLQTIILLLVKTNHNIVLLTTIHQLSLLWLIYKKKEKNTFWSFEFSLTLLIPYRGVKLNLPVLISPSFWLYLKKTQFFYQVSLPSFECALESYGAK